MTEKLKYLDYWFLLRPTLFFPVWTVFLAGYHANQQFVSDAELAGKGNNPLLVMILLTMMMGAVFIYNQLVDIETDAKNQKLFFIANGIISKSRATIEGILLTLLPVAGAFFLDTKLGLIFTCTFIFTGIIYNIKPFSWKDRPILGILTNFGGGWSVAACGWIAGGAHDWTFSLYAVPYALGLVAVFLLTTIPDIPGDRECQKITFGVRYGQKVTVYWAIGFELTTVVLSYYLKDFIIFFPALAALPLFVIAAARQRIESVLQTIKFTVLFASLAVCIIYPVYFVVIVFNFYFSKWYYRKRFKLDYPKFAA